MRGPRDPPYVQRPETNSDAEMSPSAISVHSDPWMQLFLFIVRSFLLIIEFFCLQLCLGAFSLTIGAFFPLQLELFYLQFKPCAYNQGRNKYTPPPWKPSFFKFFWVWGSLVSTLLSGPMVYTFSFVFPGKSYTPFFGGLCDLGVG